MSISTIALIAALAALPTAQDAEPRIETRSEVRIVTTGGPDGPGRIDANEDGFVTREEFTAPLSNAFVRMDADGDGRLSTEEMRSRHPQGEGHEAVSTFSVRRGGPSGHGPGDVMVFRDGPYWAMGSFNGRPAISSARAGSSPACSTTPSEPGVLARIAMRCCGTFVPSTASAPR